MGQGACLNYFYIWWYPMHRKRTVTYESQDFAIGSKIAKCDHKLTTPGTEPEIGTDGSSQTRHNARLDMYRSGIGAPRPSRSGFWSGVELNKTVFPVQIRTAGTLPGPVANTSRQCLRRPLSVAPNCHAERCSSQTAGVLNISNYTILNTFKLHTTRIRLLAALHDAVKLLSLLNPRLKNIQSNTWTCFLISNSLKSLQTRSLNQYHQLQCRRKYIPVPALRRVITLLSHEYTLLRVALRRTYKTLPASHMRRQKSTNISSVRSGRRAWRRTMTTYWRKKTPLCISQSSQMWMASRSLWLASLMIRLSGSDNYSLSNIWDGMNIHNALSNTGDESSSIVWDGCKGSQPTLSISFVPLIVTCTAICPRNAIMLKCKLHTHGLRHSYKEILKDNNVQINIYSTLRVGHTLIPLIFMWNGPHILNFVGDVCRHIPCIESDLLKPDLLKPDLPRSILISMLHHHP